MSQPVIVSIPHHLGREEAVRRIKSGLAAARSNYSALLNIREETWDGDSLVFNMRRARPERGGPASTSPRITCASK